MTSALLHRSRSFVRLARAPVDILTFDERPDYAEVIADLRRRGELIDGMRILNLWDWFRQHPLRPDAPGQLALDRHVFTPLRSSRKYESVHRGDAELTRTRFAADGTTVLQVDHYRADGTLMVVDRRDVRTRGEVGGRSVVLCDETGAPLRSWGRIWAFYRFWIDRLREREPSFLIVDSKTVARFALTYRRKRAVMVHVVHSSHLAGPERPIGRLRASRRDVFEHLDGFDAVALLTHRQRDDVEALLGTHDNLCVIPNSHALPSRVTLSRDPSRGIVLAGLGPGKRVDHAIAAVARSGAPVRLDVYGDGPERERLEQLAAGMPVTLHGYRPNAREHLATASFSLITGTIEGFSLVIVESMAAGCIPIAYDVPYGPADVIEHGRNGMLVPSGDIDALAGAIAALCDLPPREVMRMRRAARRTARRFSDLAVTREWAHQLRTAAARKAAAWPSPANPGVTPIAADAPAVRS